MSNDVLAGNWKQFTGSILEKWGKLTKDDLTVIAGQRDQLAGRLQERYGIATEEAHRQIKEFEDGHKLNYSSRLPK